jgi:hypothetical protein
MPNLVTAIIVYSKRFGVNYFNLLFDNNTSESVFLSSKLYLNDREVWDIDQVAKFVHIHKNVSAHITKNNHVATEVRFYER